MKIAPHLEADPFGDVDDLTLKPAPLGDVPREDKYARFSPVEADEV